MLHNGEVGLILTPDKSESHDTNTGAINEKQAAKTAAAEPITPAEYRAFQQAYDFLSVELFGASLSHVLVTFQRHAKARG